MESLASHRRAFVRDVELPESEFREATAALQEMGQPCTDGHNAFVLMSGSLGASSPACLLNNTRGGGETKSQNLHRPFWHLDAPHFPDGGNLVRSPTQADTLRVELLVVDTENQPGSQAQVDVWQCSGDGYIENKDATLVDYNLRGKFTSDPEGMIGLRTVRPSGYPIPVHTVVGRMLKTQDRHPFCPAHSHALVFKRG